MSDTLHHTKSAFSTQTIEHINQTHKLRHHISIQLDVQLSIPIDIHIELDPLRLGLRDDHIVKAERHLAQIEFGEVQRRQRAGKHGFEHGLGDVFGHLRGGGGDVGPEEFDDVI